MKILILLLCMYLAAMTLNVIQLCRLYRNLIGSLDFFIILGSLLIMIKHPLFVLIGLKRSFQNWDWMEGRFYKGDDGNLYVKKGESVEND